MTAGKAASQAGHAFLDSFVEAPQDIAKAYLADGGTKIVLSVPGEKELCDLYHAARMAKLPCAMVIESEHIMLPSFDGSPVATAIGVGPLPRSSARKLTRRFKLMA